MGAGNRPATAELDHDRTNPEIDVARTLEVGRPVVREAMSMLEATGLLVARKEAVEFFLPFSFGSAGACSPGVMPKCVAARSWRSGKPWRTTCRLRRRE
jgi:hypothetical protein